MDARNYYCQAVYQKRRSRTSDNYVSQSLQNLLPLIIANGGVEIKSKVSVLVLPTVTTTAVLLNLPQLALEGVIPLAAMFEERLGILHWRTTQRRSYRWNDLRLRCTWYERFHHDHSGYRWVGSGIVINGQMVYGHDGFAGELGHVIIRRENGRLCGCGRHGCLETFTVRYRWGSYSPWIPDCNTEQVCFVLFPAESITSGRMYTITAVQGDKLAQEISLTLQVIFWVKLIDVSHSQPWSHHPVWWIGKIGDYIFKPIQTIDRQCAEYL